MEAVDWLSEMSRRLEKRIPDRENRLEYLRAIHYEATRAGLDPQLVLGLIQVESGFKKYAVSSAGARGLMQVMPFWIKVIGRSDDNLFHLRTNLRYGCTILRHYLDIEKGDQKSKAVLDAMSYSIAKEIGAMAAVLKGQVDAILLTGGVAYNEPVNDVIREHCSFLAPIFIYPGEDEMGALMLNALSVLRGERTPKVYA